MPLRQNKKSPESGNFGAVFDWASNHADEVQTCQNRGVSRGDRGGVRGWRGVVLAYNFLLKSKTYILVRWAFPAREPFDAGIHISQWNQSCAFI